jgi:hypothetical protein
MIWNKHLGLMMKVTKAYMLFLIVVLLLLGGDENFRMSVW